MDINELGEKIGTLEIDIIEAISPLVEKFKSETGLSPHGIRIDMTDATGIGDAQKHYVVTGCRAQIEVFGQNGLKIVDR